VPPQAANEVTASQFAVTISTFVAGFFSFAVLLSVVAESVQHQFEVVRGGRLPVQVKDLDLVLLGWNDLVRAAWGKTGGGRCHGQLEPAMRLRCAGLPTCSRSLP
jgi:hypothetical protein